jgi:hypothetical protein
VLIGLLSGFNIPVQATKDHLSSPKTFAIRMYRYQNGTNAQWHCLDKLWTLESQWQLNATNGNAYGIPQALPGNRMARYGDDWKYNYQTQLRWGLNYIKERWHNDACEALSHEYRKGWY